MFSKGMAALMAGFLVFGMVACSGENERPSKLVDVKLKGDPGKCLREINQKISRYFDGLMSEKELSEVWNCLDKALDDFVDITAPEHPQGYPPDALARFFESFFVKRDIPLPLAKALMNLKRVFIGGQREFLTSAEIARLRVFLRKSKDWSLRLHPHIDALLLNHIENLRFEDLKRAHEELSKVVYEIGIWMEWQDQVYTQAEVRELLVSLSSWLKPANNLDLFVESLPMFFNLKSLLIGGTSRDIQAGEWPLFLQKSAAVLSLVEEYQVKSLKGSLSSLASDHTLEGILSNLSALFRGVNVPYSNFREVLSQASALSWWPEDLPAEALGDAVQFFIQSFLQVDKGKPFLIIDHRVEQALSGLRGEFLSALEPDANPEFEDFYRSMGTLSSNEKGMIIFDGGLHVTNDAIKRNQLAVVHTILKRIMESYEVNGFVERDQFQRIFSEILEKIQDLGLLTSVDTSYANRLFREMNVFMKVSDGNQNVSKSEVGMYVWMVLSAYSQQEWIRSEMPKGCFADRECSLRFLAAHTDRYLYNYPQLRDYLLGLSEDQRVEFFVLAGRACSSESLLQNFVILSYVEFFMMRFDGDDDGFLVLDEVLGSFEVFGPTLEELLSGLVSSDDIQAFFTFLFRYGYMPGDFSHPGSLLRYLNWKLFPDKWESHADRMRLLQILSELNRLT